MEAVAPAGGLVSPAGAARSTQPHARPADNAGMSQPTTGPAASRLDRARRLWAPLTLDHTVRLLDGTVLVVAPREDVVGRTCWWRYRPASSVAGVALLGSGQSAAC